MSKYRLFISYSHDDQDKYDLVRETLTQVEQFPWSDQHLKPGTGFTEQIKNYISHSHVFVPIITPDSHKAGWVHQEIGFAVAMKVPMIPVCIGELPAGMIQMDQAVVEQEVTGKSLHKLAAQDFDRLVEDAGKKWLPSGELAYEPGERARMIESYSDAARSAIGTQCVRHSGGLSSFAIPDEAPDHHVWKARYGSKSRGQETYGFFRRERQALEEHAIEAGCKLIINYGVDLDKEYGKGVWRTRLQILVDFLESLPEEKVEIALVTERAPHALLMVGDWFRAESAAVKPVRGIQNSLFASHAPSILRSIKEFDHDLHGRIKKQGSKPGQSRSWAIETLKCKIEKLPPHELWP